MLSAAEFARYYSLTEHSKWEIAGHYPTERAILARLSDLPQRSRILDFGCSSGRLLAGLTARYACHGVEINETAAQAAGEKGLQILSLGALAGPDAPRFHAIILADVFEHLTQPLDLLRLLAACLLPGGSLIILTGNGDAPACRRDPAQFWYFRIIEHVAMLTRRHADYLAAALHLRLVQWTPLCHYDLTRREKLVQQMQHFAFWQFRCRTLAARALLRFLPVINRLRRAEVAPTFTCSRDHVLAVFENDDT